MGGLATCLGRCTGREADDAEARAAGLGLGLHQHVSSYLEPFKNKPNPLKICLNYVEGKCNPQGPSNSLFSCLFPPHFALQALLAVSLPPDPHVLFAVLAYLFPLDPAPCNPKNDRKNLSSRVGENP